MDFRVESGMRAAALTLAVGALASLIGAPAPARAQEPFTGVEIALSGAHQAVAGRPHHVRGTAYRVRGLSELVRYPRATLRARMARPEDHPAEPWVDVVADVDGHFELSVPIPRTEHGAVMLEVELTDGDEGRSWSYPLAITSPLDVMLLTDRRLYEPGETIHVFALVRDAVSLQPLARETAEAHVAGVGRARITREVTTGPDGVISFDIPVPAHAPESGVTVALLFRGGAYNTSTSIGTRTYERVFATLRATPELAAPHETVTVSIAVTTTSGAPVTGAAVDLLVDGQTHYAGATQSDGIASIAIQAPAYMTHDTGQIALVAEVTHPAHGSAHAYGRLQLAVPLTLSIDVVARLGGGLVPDVDDVFYLVVADGLGEPPPAGLEIEIEGGAVRGGRARVTTDANGIAEVPARLAFGMWGTDADSGEMHSSLFARIQGPLERTARLSLPVQTRAEICPRLATSVVHPGARLEVDLLRSIGGRGKPAVVELYGGRRLLDVRYVSGSTSRVIFDVPSDLVGLASVRARPLDESEVHEGEGAFEAFVVVPTNPSFISVAPERTEYLVGQSARVAITSTPGQTAYAAVLIRDLAAHSGEVSFQRFFLERQFDESVLAPTLPASQRLIRTALSAYSSQETEAHSAEPLLDSLGLPVERAGVDPLDPSRGTLRDPFPLARELERAGIAEHMQAAEVLLEEALANDSLDEVTVGRGVSRRFAQDVLEGETLGGGPLQAIHLEAVDPSFSFQNVARRVSRARLVHLLVALATYLDPGDEASVAARMAAREPFERWLPRMIERGLLTPEDLRDPWGGRFALHRSPRPALALSIHSTDIELVSPGPDGRIGTSDDIRDPFLRAVPAGTPYAVASGEDALMRRLALISPVARTLAAIHEAYLRITAEMTEELIGDAVHAGVSEGFGGLGLRGTGRGGGGTGSGYGSGSGSLSSHSSRTAHVRGASASVRGLARVIRQRFPATLLFRPSITLDASGTTWVDIPLQDAVTSYIVEVVSWRPDGWSWSALTRFSVDREIVVEAPVPEVARVGDEISMPVRLGNRGAEPRDILLHVLETPELGLPASAPRRVRVGAHDAVAALFTLAPTRAGEGLVRVAATTLEGEAIDAVAIPMRVVLRARRAQLETDAFVDVEGVLEYDIPAGASAREGDVTVVAGVALFAEPDDRAWAEWSEVMGDTQSVATSVQSDPIVARHVRVGAAWGFAGINDVALEAALRHQTRELDELDRSDDIPARVDAQSRMLLGLAAVSHGTARRPALADAVGAHIERLRTTVAADAASAGDDPELLVSAAAALAWTRSGRDSRAAEFLRRAERGLIDVGDEHFVAAVGDPMRATALFALADVALGNRERALGLIRTLARWSARGRPLSSEVRAYARLVLRTLEGDEHPSAGMVVIDGSDRPLEHASAGERIEESSLAAPGHHRVTVRVEHGAIIHASVRARYGLPWETAEVRGPVSISLEGASGGLDDVATFELVIRNRTPRTIAAPVVEIDLPTGAELPEATQRLFRRISRTPPVRSSDLLTITLSGMPPGAERRIPLPLRWSVAGTLPGLGVVCYAADRPAQVSVLPPRVLTIEGGEQ